MDSMKFVCSCLASLFALSVTFSKISLGDAAASGLPDGGHFMSVADTVALFGDTIGITYMDSSGVYHSVSAYYTQSPSDIALARDWNDTTGYTVSGRTFITYQFETEGTLNAEPRNITVDLNCQYSIFDTEYIYTCAAMPCSSQTNISAYNSPQWSWVWAGREVVFSPSDIAVNNLLPQIYFSDYCDFIPAYMTSQSITSGYSLRVVFDHASLSNGRYGRFYLGVPYVSQGASGYNGTSGLTTTVSEVTTTGINVNVDVDLQETNGLLGGIITAIEGLANSILSGLAALFVPTDTQLITWKTNMQTLLSQHLGGLYDAVDIISNWIENLTIAEASSSIHINSMSIPLAGETFVMGPYDVPLKYEGLEPIYTGLALIIDFICTAAFINMCRNKLEIFLNPNSEKIEE